jgi:hypothetical protein
MKQEEEEETKRKGYKKDKGKSMMKSQSPSHCCCHTNTGASGTRIQTCEEKSRLRVKAVWTQAQHLIGQPTLLSESVSKKTFVLVSREIVWIN